MNQIYSSSRPSRLQIDPQVDDRGKHATWWLPVMKYDTYIVHRSGVNRQAADVLLELQTEGTDKFNTKTYIVVMNVNTEKQKKEVSTNIPKKDYIKTNALQAPTLEKFISERSKDAYCDKMPTVGIPRSSANFDQKKLLARLSHTEGSVSNIRAAAKALYDLTLRTLFNPCSSSRRAPDV